MNDTLSKVQSTNSTSATAVTYLSNPQSFKKFEKLYLSVRKKEARLYPDELVKRLPFINPRHPLEGEWKIRATSAKNFIGYLKQKLKSLTILDLGCGNGWFANSLSKELDCHVTALDINEKELKQGIRVFGNTAKISFVYGNIFEDILSKSKFDVILLASSVQYFSDLNQLLNQLKTLLFSDGEIHIIDSPFYSEVNIISARSRTQGYYNSLGFPEMSDHYHHHTFDSFQDFTIEYLQSTGSLFQQIRKRISARFRPSFPWIKLTVNST